MKVITLADIEYITFELAKSHLSFSEPIPDFSTRFPNILESCIMTPFQKFSGKDLYPSLIAKPVFFFISWSRTILFRTGTKESQ